MKARALLLGKQLRFLKALAPKDRRHRESVRKETTRRVQTVLLRCQRGVIQQRKWKEEFPLRTSRNL